MNRFTYEELFVGQTAEFSREITNEMMDKFCEISGDVNPLHKEESFAKDKGYPGRVVYGMLTSAMYSCLGGYTYPGKIVFYKVFILIFSPQCLLVIR
ncbi:MaoC/PaaZ C-terminal domain-containing protein [Selenomonas ruminantium]|uniref:3-hydroxybutyryl-CoA dehydratase n=1 Tax=Selenomonas ruminantium TaxID=971 RepID=A0A1I0WK02_SELRU|nr:MaoC/PaaZ C-terminal domain-containing protein [Selenomonas ruminantium]SFA88323.1 3-hydroxybutyryl-CoA dehydratase [Selenomonas ruminantium]